MINRRAARWMGALLKCGVTLGAAWFVFMTYGTSRVFDLAKKADPMLLAAAALITLVQLFILAGRWQLLHKLVSGVLVPMRLLFASLGRSLLLGQFLPPVIGSDAIRIANIGRQAGLMMAARSVVSDRLVGVSTLVILAIVTLPVFASLVNYGPAAMGLVMTCFGGVTLLLVIITWGNVLHRLPLAGPYLGQATSDMRLVLRSALGLSAIGLGLISHVLSVLIFAVLARSCGSDVSIAMCFAIMPPAMLISVAPISLSGWGVREAAVSTAFALVGGDPLVGTTASILYGLTNPLAGLFGELLGLVPLTYSNSSRGEAEP